MKAPNKIYVYKEQENYYVLNEQCLGNIEVDKVIFTSHEMIPYILESEHNRIIESLKKEEEIRVDEYKKSNEIKETFSKIMQWVNSHPRKATISTSLIKKANELLKSIK